VLVCQLLKARKPPRAEANRCTDCHRSAEDPGVWVVVSGGPDPGHLRLQDLEDLRPCSFLMEGVSATTGYPMGGWDLNF
jgi:hypothetical protein